MGDAYRILNVSQNATEEEVDLAYRELRAKYREDRFLEGDAGSKAAKNLTALETAYQEIKEEFKLKKVTEDFGSAYGEIEIAIKNGNIDLAQIKLDEVRDRTGEWHYLQSIVFYRKNWHNESRVQLEIAVKLEPNNAKYREALTKLNYIVGSNNVGNNNNNNNNYNQQNNRYAQNGNNSYRGNQPGPDQQMGSASNCCCSLCLMDQCCECMGGDLISCC